MAEYHRNHQEEEGVETGDRGLLDFTKKKDEEEVISSEFDEKVMVSDQNPYNLHTSSTSSSEEEEYCDEEEKKSIKEKLQQDKVEMDTEVPIEKIHVEEEEIKDKLPGHQAGDDVACPPPTPAPVVGEECSAPPPAQEEKKGLLEKIKDKIPGLHSKDTTSTTTCEEEEEKAKAKAKE